MAHNESILNFRGKAPPESKFFPLSFELRHSLCARNDNSTSKFPNCSIKLVVGFINQSLLYIEINRKRW
jgi:hypothetical protein